MEEYLNKGIKEIITKFPKVADILNDYNIGCVPCNVGTCLLKDIVKIHNLSPDEETALFARIAREIYPGRDIKIPKTERRPQPKGFNYSPPIKMLVEEHVYIKKLLALIPEIVNRLDLKSEEGRVVILKSVDFIRSYADKYHHAKEEDILFKYFDADDDIIKAMLEDHKSGRSHVKAIMEGVEKQDEKLVAEHLAGYGELLKEHIKKEDEILYPWMDRNMTMDKVGKMFQEFHKVDEEIGQAVPRNYEKFVVELEEKMKVNPSQKSEKIR